MADFAVIFDTVSGYVLGMWERTTSDNIATFAEDDKLTVDSVDVAVGFAGSVETMDVALVSDPTDSDVLAGGSVFEVDNLTTPTDVTNRTDGGSRDSVYFDETDDHGIYVAP